MLVRPLSAKRSQAFLESRWSAVRSANFLVAANHFVIRVLIGVQVCSNIALIG